MPLSVDGQPQGELQGIKVAGQYRAVTGYGLLIGRNTGTPVSPEYKAPFASKAKHFYGRQKCCTTKKLVNGFYAGRNGCKGILVEVGGPAASSRRLTSKQGPSLVVGMVVRRLKEGNIRSH